MSHSESSARAPVFRSSAKSASRLSDLQREFNAYKEGSEEAFRAVVEQSHERQRKVAELEQVITCMQGVIESMRKNSNELLTACTAAEVALRQQGGTLDAMRLHTAILKMKGLAA